MSRSWRRTLSEASPLMPTEEVHFIATIEVKKVVRKVPDPVRYPTDKAEPEKKHVSTIARVVITNGELAELRNKVGAHLSLVDDGGDIDERVTR